jgi:hypothetical protein
LYNQYGSDYLYQTKLHSGDLVRYNGLKYVVLGIVVNTYAQWNMPTPLLFNPTNLNNDYKSLYGSKLTEKQIDDKINDNFQAGKYDADMIIPLVDANDFSEYITVIEPRPSKEEVELMYDSVKAEKELTIKSQKDVFIDTMLRLRGNEINKIKEDMYKLGLEGVTNYIEQTRAVSEEIYKARAAGNMSKVLDLMEQQKNLAQHGGNFTSLSETLLLELERFSALKAKFERAEVDVKETLNNKFTVSGADVAEQRAYPVRKLIVLVTLIATILFSALLFAIYEKIQTTKSV